MPKGPGKLTVTNAAWRQVEIKGLEFPRQLLISSALPATLLVSESE